MTDGTKLLVVHIVIFVLDEAVMGIREVREGLVHLLAVVEVFGLPRRARKIAEIFSRRTEKPPCSS